MKDDSGSCAVFTEWGSSASQMTAAKVMDITSRLPGCARQAADAVSAYTQVGLEYAPSLLKKFRSQNVQIHFHWKFMQSFFFLGERGGEGGLIS